MNGHKVSCFLFYKNTNFPNETAGSRPKCETAVSSHHHLALPCTNHHHLHLPPSTTTAIHYMPQPQGSRAVQGYTAGMGLAYRTHTLEHCTLRGYGYIPTPVHMRVQRNTAVLYCTHGFICTPCYNTVC